MNASSNVNAANRQQKYALPCAFVGVRFGGSPCPSLLFPSPGRTSLMHACEHGAADVVQMLLQRGAAVRRYMSQPSSACVRVFPSPMLTDTPF